MSVVVGAVLVEVVVEELVDVVEELVEVDVDASALLGVVTEADPSVAGDPVSSPEHAISASATTTST